MGKSSFCMSDILNQNSDIAMVNKLPELKLLPLTILEPSEKNFYNITEIEALANSILNEGLEQPLFVIRKGASYILNAGHRRMAALKMLVSWGYEEFQQAPCIIRNHTNEILEEMALINSNATTRVLTDYEKMEQATRMKQLLLEAEKQGIKIKGKKRTLIAEHLNTSESQIARYDSIKNHLSEDFRQDFKNEKIGLSVAAELATLPKEEQKELYQNFREQETVITLAEVKEKKGKPCLDDVPKHKEKQNIISNSEPEKTNTSTDSNQIVLQGYEVPPEPEPVVQTDSINDSIKQSATKLLDLMTALAAYQFDNVEQTQQLVTYLFENRETLDTAKLEQGRMIIGKLWRLFSLKVLEEE